MRLRRRKTKSGVKKTSLLSANRPLPSGYCGEILQTVLGKTILFEERRRHKTPVEIFISLHKKK
jgi:hypothetical protein